MVKIAFMFRRPVDARTSVDVLVSKAPTLRLATKYPEGRLRLCNGSIKNKEIIVVLTRRHTRLKQVTNGLVMSLNKLNCTVRVGERFAVALFAAII